ncbi:MAG: InlB B-repeat-containing protein [[Eubacterium] siraeum]|nr:InlB B-repeat-containing protein [[Eubacterium] siraeum]
MSDGSKFCPICGNSFDTDENNIATKEISIKSNLNKRKLVIVIVALVLIIITISLSLYFTIGFKKTYTITFDACGGVCAKNSMQYKGYERLSLPNPTRTGYLFSGWYSDPSYSSGSNVKADFVANKQAKGDMTLYARWAELKSYDINLGNINNYFSTSFSVKRGTLMDTITFNIHENEYSLYPNSRTISFSVIPFWMVDISVTIEYNGQKQTVQVQENRTHSLFMLEEYILTFSNGYPNTNKYATPRISNVTGTVTLRIL